MEKFPFEFTPSNQLADFIFVWWKLGDDGVFISREHYQFLLQFRRALATAELWGDFLEAIGPWGARFIAPFMQCDDIKPSANSKMTDLYDELFILHEEEFPLTQCAEETFTKHISRLLLDEPYDYLVTEYGMRIGYYSTARFVALKDKIECQGPTVDCKRAEFPLTLHDYSSSIPGSSA